jgi:hypothetical protein
MKVVVQEYFKPFQQAYRITDDALELAVNDPSSKKVLKPENDKPKILFLRRISDGTWILVDGRYSRKNNTLEVGAAFRLFDHVITEAQSNDPLIIMQHIVMQFGFMLEIGEQHNKFIYQSSFNFDPKLKEVEVIKIIRPAGRMDDPAVYSYGQRTIRIDDQAVMEVILAYAIDSKRYVEWLKENDGYRAEASM